MSYLENFDSSTVGTIPSGWVVDAHATVQVGTLHSSPNVLATSLDAASAHWGYVDSPDDGGGNNLYEVWVQFDASNQIAELVYRLNPGTGITDGSYCALQVQATAGTPGTVNGSLSRTILGTSTTVGQVTTGQVGIIPIGEPIRLRVLANGNRHQCEIFIPSSNLYVTPTATTSATQQFCVDATDTDPAAISGAGRSGILWYLPSGTNILFDDLSTTPIAAPLAAGVASFVSSGTAGIVGTATEATGGTSPYSHQWQRNTDGGSYSNLSDGGGVSGAATLNIADGSAVAGHLCGYELVYTDSAGTPATATSNAFTAQVYAGGPLTAGGSTYSRGRVVNG